MRFSLIPLLLIVIPIAEIATFIVVGQYIGILPTLGLILLTAIIGTTLLRWQGVSILNRISAETHAGRVPGRDLVHGAMILVAGVLLLTPGFVTDTLGFLLFVPAVRDRAWLLLKNRITVVASNGIFTARTGDGGMPPRGGPRGGSQGGHRGGPVVDLDADEYSHSAENRNSPWRADGNAISEETDKRKH